MLWRQLVPRNRSSSRSWQCPPASLHHSLSPPSLTFCMNAGKDRVVKYWDADKFEHLLTLEGHHAEVGTCQGPMVFIVCVGGGDVAVAGGAPR